MNCRPPNSETTLVSPMTYFLIFLMFFTWILLNEKRTNAGEHKRLFPSKPNTHTKKLVQSEREKTSGNFVNFLISCNLKIGHIFRIGL